MRRKKGIPTQLPILRVLWKNPKTDVSFLKKRTGFSTQQIHDALYHLENRKLIKKPTYNIVNKPTYRVPPIKEKQIELWKEKPFQIDRIRGLLGIRKSDKETIESPKEKIEEEGDKKYIFIPDKLE